MPPPFISNNSITIPVDEDMKDEDEDDEDDDDDENSLDNNDYVNAGALSFEDMLTMYYPKDTQPRLSYPFNDTTSVAPSLINIGKLIYKIYKL